MNMKNLLLILAITFISANYLHSQTQSVTLEQLKIYEINKAKYINKPLKCLLNDIIYPIKKFIAYPSFETDLVGQLTFFFGDTTKSNENGYKPRVIAVYLYQNENFMLKEKPYPRSRIKPRTWDIKYIDSIGHLKIKGIGVFERE